MKSKNKIVEPQDKTKVDVNEKGQLNYWTRELNISTTFLSELVNKAGNSIEDIRYALRINRMYRGQ